MAEVRRVKMKIGDAEFEADVPEDRVQPMYDQFLSALERRSLAFPRLFDASVKIPNDVAVVETTNGEASLTEVNDQLLGRVFEVRKDGVVTLKVLPTGHEKEADALLLLLYGYRRLKNEDEVLATQLLRAAEHSGIPIRRPAHKLAAHERLVTRSGHRKGSAYSLNDQGLQMAEVITTRIFQKAEH